MKAKATGMSRPLDALGRVVIPKEIRDSLEWDTGDTISIYVDGDSVVLRKATNTCIFCQSEEIIATHNGKHICADCLAALKG